MYTVKRRKFFKIVRKFDEGLAEFNIAYMFLNISYKTKSLLGKHTYKSEKQNGFDED